MFNTAVIIAAAGSSQRMGGGIPKQYRQTEGVPMLVKTVGAFSCFCRIIVASDDPERARSLLETWYPGWMAPAAEPGCPKLEIVAGGGRRQDSVANALCLVREPNVLVHDAARPYVTPELIGRVLEGLKSADAVVPGVMPKSTIRTAERTLDRASLFEVQTPQGFKTEVLIQAHQSADKDGFEGTDDASLVERLGIPAAVVPGDYANVKVTTPEDLPASIRTGTGYDVHRFAAGRKLMLGCLEIPYGFGLLGHSDADVLVHAISDALLGAAALGDIGRLWPDNIPETEDMAGSYMLEQVARLLRQAGCSIVNVDATVIAEKPRLAPYAEEMRRRVAEHLGIEISQISIKATTEEGLGQRSSEGMAAMASVNIRG